MEKNYIRTVKRTTCPVCDSDGAIIFNKMKDKMFGTGGEWQLRKCNSNECECLWLDPQPVEADIGQAYLNYYTHSDDYVPSESFVRRLARTSRDNYLHKKYGYPVHASSSRLSKKVLSRLLHFYPLVKTASDFSVMHLPYQPNGSVLEVGCGSGYLLNNLKMAGWKNVKGIDFDSSAIEYARSKGLDVECGDLESVELANSSFDAIVISHVIEHLYNPFDVLEHIFELLKPGGIIVIVTPNSRAIGRILFRQNWRGLEPPRHIQIFSPAGLKALCVRSGFTGVEVRTTVRGAAGLFAQSLAIARSNNSNQVVTVTTFERIAGRIMQAIEMIVLFLVRERGEELVVIGRKPHGLREHAKVN